MAIYRDCTWIEFCTRLQCKILASQTTLVQCCGRAGPDYFLCHQCLQSRAGSLLLVLHRVSSLTFNSKLCTFNIIILSSSHNVGFTACMFTGITDEQELFWMQIKNLQWHIKKMENFGQSQLLQSAVVHLVIHTVVSNFHLRYVLILWLL